MIRSGSANPGVTNSLLPWPISTRNQTHQDWGWHSQYLFRAPALIASTVATLDERSGGRILLGLGPSGANVIEHWHGVPFKKPVQRTREYVEIIRMILRGEKLVYNSEIFHLERGFKLRFTPPRTEIPIYIAAMGPKNVVQSGEISDGILPVYWPGNKWGELPEELDEGARKAGRPPHSAMIAPYITSVILSENASEEEIQSARFAAAAPLAYYIGKMGVYHAQMLTRNGYGAEVEAVQEGWKPGDERWCRGCYARASRCYIHRWNTKTDCGETGSVGCRRRG